MPEEKLNKPNGCQTKPETDPNLNGCQTEPETDPWELSSVGSCSSSISQNSDSQNSDSQNSDSQNSDSQNSDSQNSDSQKKHITFSESYEVRSFDLINGSVISDKRMPMAFYLNKVALYDSCTKKDFTQLFDSFNINTAKDFNNFIKSEKVLDFFVRRYQACDSSEKEEIIKSVLHKLEIRLPREIKGEAEEDSNKETSQELKNTFLKRINKDVILKFLRNARYHYIPANTTRPSYAQVLEEVTLCCSIW
jgi:hypothetical protein